MYKNIILLFLLILVLTACGKKSEPVYKTESNNKVKIITY